MVTTNSNDLNSEALSVANDAPEKKKAGSHIRRKKNARPKSEYSRQKKISARFKTVFSSISGRVLTFRPARTIWLPGIGGFILVILIGLVIRASYHNLDRYYLRSAAGAVEIWQGTFSPTGKRRILIMPGVQMPAGIKNVYAKEEVFSLAFHFYTQKADALMEVPGMPDFIGIKSYLNRALSFATTAELRQMAHARINQIDRLILFYKADVAATKGTRAGLEAALNYLDQAAELNPDDIETEVIKKKKASIRELLNTL
jgi:colicin import membrane protein